MSPDEKLIAIATGDKNAAIYNLENGAPVVTAGAHAGEVLGVTYSPDSAILATAGADWTVKLWDTKTRTMLADLKAHNNTVPPVAFSPDGKLLCTASVDGSAKLWEVNVLLIKSVKQCWTFHKGRRLSGALHDKG